MFSLRYGLDAHILFDELRLRRVNSWGTVLELCADTRRTECYHRNFACNCKYVTDYYNFFEEVRRRIVQIKFVGYNLKALLRRHVCN
jgi:hypothetical protein